VSKLNRVPTTVFELGVHRQWSAPGGSPNSTSRSWCRLIQRLTGRQNRKARPGPPRSSPPQRTARPG
jgi:hypothetical protein